MICNYPYADPLIHHDKLLKSSDKIEFVNESIWEVYIFKIKYIIKSSNFEYSAFVVSTWQG